MKKDSQGFMPESLFQNVLLVCIEKITAGYNLLYEIQNKEGPTCWVDIFVAFRL